MAEGNRTGATRMCIAFEGPAMSTVRSTRRSPSPTHRMRARPRRSRPTVGTRIAAAAGNWQDALKVPVSARRNQLLAVGACIAAGWAMLIGAAASTLG